MYRAMASLVFVCAFAAESAHAAGSAVFQWVCNLEGAPGRLTAYIEAVSPAGIYMDPSGLFAGSIPTDEINYNYQGELVSASARYAFSGRNAYADFVDLIHNERFQVQFVIQGRQLLLIANPFGPGPTQYLCEMQ